MAKSLSSLVSSKSDKPPVFLIYGNDGVGKTTLASEFPDALYLNTPGEETPSDVELATVPGGIETYNDLCSIMNEVLTTSHGFKTLIVDSLDGLEPMVWAKTCARLGVKTIEEPGYGKGYKEADEEWMYLIHGFLALKQAGIHVVLLAHPKIKRFDSPTSDPYDRYEIRLHDRANGAIRDKSDVVAFLKQRVTLKEKEVARQTKVAHGESGGDIEIHLQERPGFSAKNRYGMPPRITFKKGSGYSEMAKFFPAPTGFTPTQEAA